MDEQYWGKAENGNLLEPSASDECLPVRSGKTLRRASRCAKEAFVGTGAGGSEAGIGECRRLGRRERYSAIIV